MIFSLGKRDQKELSMRDNDPKNGFAACGNAGGEAVCRGERV